MNGIRTYAFRALLPVTTASGLLMFVGSAQAATIMTQELQLWVAATGTGSQTAGGTWNTQTLPKVFDNALDAVSPGDNPFVSALTVLSSRASEVDGQLRVSARGESRADANQIRLDPAFEFSDSSSTFSYTLNLEKPHHFDLGGSIAASVIARSSVSLTGPGDRIEFSLGHFDDSTQALARTGLLSPGEYVLSGSANAIGFYNDGAFERGAAAFDVDFSLTPVPLPAALPLFGLSIASLLGFRRWARA